MAGDRHAKVAIHVGLLNSLRILEEHLHLAVSLVRKVCGAQERIDGRAGLPRHRRCRDDTNLAADRVLR